MTEKQQMTGSPKWSSALLVAAVPVLVAGSFAWVFPGETAAAFGTWALPGVSLVVLALALVLAADWPWLRGFVIVFASTLVLGWMKVPGSPTAASHLTGASLGLLLMFLVGRVATTPERLRLATLAFLGGGLAALVLGFAGTGADLPKGLSVGPINAKLPAIRLGVTGIEASGRVNSNALAAVALMTVPIGASVLLVGYRKKLDVFCLRPVGFLVALAGVLVLALAQSRSAWIAIWLAMAALLVRGLDSLLQRLIVGLLVLALPFAVIGRVQMLDKEAFVLEAGRVWGSVHDRTHIMTSGARQFSASPWFGIGLNEFRHVYQFPAEQPGNDIAHAHNMLLQTALDIGLFGLTAYCCILGFLLIRADQAARRASRLCRSIAVGAAMSLVAVSAFGLADAVPLGAKIGLFQWMASGLILAAWQIRSTETP